MSSLNEISTSVQRSGNPFASETVGDPGLLPIPRTLETIAYRPAQVLLEEPSSSQQPSIENRIGKYAVVRPKNSPDIEKVGKLYRGLLRQLPPPQEITEEWDKGIGEKLIEQLAAVASMLPAPMPDEDVMVESMLCMAGNKSTSTGIGQYWADKVILEPTIWISCGSRKCRRKIRSSMTEFTFLDGFIRKFGMGRPHIAIQTLALATDEIIRPPFNNKTPFVDDSNPISQMDRIDDYLRQRHMMIASPFIEPYSLEDRIAYFSQTAKMGFAHAKSYPRFGTRVKWTMETENDFGVWVSTIGGMLKVDNKLFGLTTAHGVINGVELLRSGQKSSDRTEDKVCTDTEEDSSGSESEGSSLTDHHKDHDREDSGVTWRRASDMIPSELPRILAFDGRGTTTGDYLFSESAPPACDFALLDMDRYAINTNYYITGNILKPVAELTGILPLENMSAGEVSIILTPRRAPVEGYLLDTLSTIVHRGNRFRTKKVQVSDQVAVGSSGAWVVRSEKVVGTVFAVYDGSPYVHIIPIEDTFQAIKQFMGATSIEIYDSTVDSLENSSDGDLYGELHKKAKLTADQLMKQRPYDPMGLRADADRFGPNIRPQQGPLSGYGRPRRRIWDPLDQ